MVLRFYIFGQSYDEISDASGLRFLPDCLHLNERAADIVAEVAAPFIEGLQ